MIQDSPGDAQFYRRQGPFSLADIAIAANGRASKSDRMLTGLAPLHSAGPNDVSFLSSSRYVSALGLTNAGAVIVHPDMEKRVPSTAVAILTEATYEALARVAALFHPITPPVPGIHPTAFVAASAYVDPTAQIGPFACIEENVRVGPGCHVGSHASIGSGVVMGENCRIGTHASVSHAILGARVYLYSGVRIGQEGFSFARTKTGYLSIPHLGRVVIEDDVEIGANATVDRGSIQDTVIGAGTRIDNLVQIGHNVRLGRACVVVAQVGISGSTVLEDFVQVGGQAAMAGHLQIGQGAQIGAQAGVISDVPAGAILLGSPAQPRQEFFRQVATLRRLARRPK